ncbi:MAG: hypothetical protein QME96_06470 [Myxococcota bacterium]|nr:hypothetical protein [Myxococcota bacterium]
MMRVSSAVLVVVFACASACGPRPEAAWPASLRPEAVSGPSEWLWPAAGPPGSGPRGTALDIEAAALPRDPAALPSQIVRWERATAEPGPFGGPHPRPVAVWAAGGMACLLDDDSGVLIGVSLADGRPRWAVALPPREGHRADLSRIAARYRLLLEHPHHAARHQEPVAREASREDAKTPRARRQVTWRLCALARDPWSGQLDAPSSDGAERPDEVVTVQDPSHPLCGRSFRVASRSPDGGEARGARYLVVLYGRGDIPLRIPVEAVSEPRNGHQPGTKLSSAAVEELLSVARSCGACSSPRAGCGRRSPRDCAGRSSRT